MPNQSVINKNVCQHCALSQVCFGNSKTDSAAPTKKSHRVYHRGETLFSMGDQFEALFILRAGSAKSYLNSSRGDEQICGFYQPGDLIGVEGFDTMTYPHSFKFLETSSVCRISMPEFNRAMADSSTMRLRLLQNMSHYLVHEQQLLLSVSKLSAEQRLANFLLDCSQRFKQRGLSQTVFNLSMTRIDIANFLGMAIETISRLLSKMQNKGIINVNGRKITLLDIPRLHDCLLSEEDKRAKTSKVTSTGSSQCEYISLSA